MKTPRLFVRTPGTDGMLCYCGGPDLSDAIRGLANHLKVGGAEGEPIDVDVEIREMTDEEVAALSEF